MKKFINICLMLVILLSNVTATNAEEKYNNSDFKETIEKYETHEKPMPSTFGRSAFPLMENWKNETKNYLQEIYTQDVIEITEDDEKIVYIFEVEEFSSTEQVETVEYFKNNTKLRSVTGDIKITSYEQWSNGAVPVNVDSRTVSNFAAAGAILISLVPRINIGLSDLISSVAAVVGWTIDSKLPIQTETRAAVKYRRKIGNYYLKTGVWYPSVHIGRVEYWYYVTCYQKKTQDGPSIPYHKDTIPNSSGTNYDKYQEKPHYSDTNWIISKVRSLGSSGSTYFDFYG
ncbi:hypothetical protein [Anaerorhabdus furcosa]|uniref:Uncharacterized protein n=1 Tax=Anaerorhabdus furcosa TaxID=118967 RepID=A0A1T4PMG8_9FIRM|nr:hypothetical protein [Anaerorhabdus furcosa]SJZ92088.1 hypothetical protein SAMN02745191_2087 [Anaerorhabdus furcosa]